MALVSVLAHAPERRELVAITDHPERFEGLARDVTVHRVTAEQLAAWIGPNPVSMRQKIEAARAVLPADGNLVLMDADTLAVKDLRPLVDALNSGALLLHKREFVLSESRRSGNRALWSALQSSSLRSEFTAASAMWNSGVIALRSADGSLLDEALRLYDALVAAGVRHFALEQLAVGAVFEKTGRLREANPWVTHYWGNKKAFEEEIGKRLEAGRTPDVVARELRTQPINLPSEVRPGKLEKIRRWLSRKNTDKHRKP